MICYRDRTYCTFYETCDKQTTCSRPLTPLVKTDAVKWWGDEGVPIAVFTEKPECHSDNYHVADTSKKINDACKIAYQKHLEKNDGTCWSRYRQGWLDALAWKTMAKEGESDD